MHLRNLTLNYSSQIVKQHYQYRPLILNDATDNL